MTDVIDGDVDEPLTEGSDTDVDDEASTTQQSASNRLAIALSVATVVVLAGLAGWLGFRAHQVHLAAAQRELFLHVGRQGAVNLTTVDFAKADADVQRILDSATGTFYTDFATRSQPFIDVVKQTRSTTVGTVTSAGVESSTRESAQVLVAVTVKTSKSGAAEPQPRYWRMRLTIEKLGDQAKVAAVEFVS